MSEVATASSSDDPRKRGSGIANWPTEVRDYVDDLKMEMKRVTWPSWKQVRATTGVVIAAVFAFGAYFFVVDAIVGKAVTKIFDTFTK